MTIFDPKKIISELDSLDARLRLSLLSKLVSLNIDTMKKYFKYPWRKFYIDTDTLLPHIINFSKLYEVIDLLVDVNKNLELEEIKILSCNLSDAVVAMDDNDFNIKVLSVQYAFYSYCNLVKYCIYPEKSLLNSIIVQAISAKFPDAGVNKIDDSEDKNKIKLFLSEWWIENRPLGLND